MYFPNKKLKSTPKRKKWKSLSTPCVKLWCCVRCFSNKFKCLSERESILKANKLDYFYNDFYCIQMCNDNNFFQLNEQRECISASGEPKSHPLFCCLAPDVQFFISKEDAVTFPNPGLPWNDQRWAWSFKLPSKNYCHAFFYASLLIRKIW
jgi:hypothetical protein